MDTALYLDHAAATPVDDRVLAAMMPFFSEQFYNPSALYSAAHSVRRAVDQARAVVAAQLGARPAEIIFTAGGSEANNLAINGVMQQWPGASMLVSPIEHGSVLAVSEQYQRSFLPVSAQGIVETSQVASLIDDTVVLISVMYANNEIGTIQPIRDIAAVAAGVRRDRRSRGIDRPVYVHVDAAQAANYLGLQTARLGIDLLSLNGGKIYGPKQSGILYVKAGLVLEPQVRGGGQESGLRSGTENVPAIIGFAEALRLAQVMRLDESKRLQDIQHYAYDRTKQLFPESIINGSIKHRLPNNLHITIPGCDNERLIFGLDDAGIMAAAGSACSASSDLPSHVLRAIGLSDETARSSLRFTMGRSTTQNDIDRLFDTLKRLV